MSDYILQWGLERKFSSDEYLACWGARAIWSENRNFIDLLWDRQDMQGTSEGKTLLTDWLNSIGFIELKRRMDDAKLTQNQNKLIIQSSGPFTITANPNSSYGYLYITATMKKEFGAASPLD